MEEKIYAVLRKHKLPLKKREELMVDLCDLCNVSKDTIIKKDEEDEVAVCPNCGHKECYPTDDNNFFNCDECGNEFG